PRINRSDRIPRQMVTIPQKAPRTRPQRSGHRNHPLPHRRTRHRRQTPRRNRRERRRRPPTNPYESFPMTTIYYGHVMDVPTSPFTGGELRSETAALAVVDGKIAYRGPLTGAQGAHPGAEVVRFDGLLIPGMVDTHVHYPQLPVVGGLGMPLLQWLDECALPQEVRLADNDHGADLPGRFLGGLGSRGTPSAPRRSHAP